MYRNHTYKNQLPRFKKGAEVYRGLVLPDTGFPCGSVRQGYWETQRCRAFKHGHPKRHDQSYLMVQLASE
jgi:hypothetical protein